LNRSAPFVHFKPFYYDFSCLILLREAPAVFMFLFSCPDDLHVERSNKRKDTANVAPNIRVGHQVTQLEQMKENT
jgi:hypothetical protein